MIGRYMGISAGNWPLDGNSNDVSGNSNNGTDSNMSYGLGRFGACGIFNGSSSRIALPNAASLKPAAVFSIMAWVRCNSVGANVTIMQNFVSASSKFYGYMFRIFADGGPGLTVAKGTGTVTGTDLQSMNGTTKIDDGLWHLVAATYDGSYIRAYADGAPCGSVAWVGLVYAATQYPMIGVRQDTAASYQQYFPGSINGGVLVPYVWSDSDIRRWYAWAKGML